MIGLHMSGTPDVIAYCVRKEAHGVFEIGDLVREVHSEQIREIVGVGPGECFRTQVGNDGATVKFIRPADLVLIQKAQKSEAETGFYPSKPPMG